MNRSKLSLASRVRRSTGRSRVEVVALVMPVIHAVAPVVGRTGIARASPWAQSRRGGLTDPEVRDGCTRLVNRIANDREVKSMTRLVPV
ncbi:Uncharacterised protein [Mycobacteroides abscessus subsp. abscessus]|nr:Uncharacterised protein [Mycobacteroides abscessus subsp. abscessus]